MVVYLTKWRQANRGAGYHGGFGHTKGAEKQTNKLLHKGQQEKHMVGSNNYIPGRSIFSGSLNYAKKLIAEFSGKGNSVGMGKERVDFGKFIGYYVDKETGKKYPTTMGIIHSSKDGKHIVPSQPKNYKGE